MESKILHEPSSPVEYVQARVSSLSVRDSRFQQILLEFSSAASKTLVPREILRLFCRTVHEYFGVSGAYIWRFVPPDQLMATEGDGWMAEEFRRAQLRTSQSAVVVEAIQKRKAVFVNSIDTRLYPMAAEFKVKSLLAAPVVVFNETIAAVVLVHTSDRDLFDQDQAEKTTILAGQLGSLLEAARLSQQTKEEKRRAAILAEVAENLCANPGSGTLVESIAGHLRTLLRTPLVCILRREASGFETWAAAAEDGNLSDLLRNASEGGKRLQFASDIANRAIVAGDLISVSVNPTSHGLEEFVPAGTLLALPFRTSNKEGAVLVYPRSEGVFTAEEKALLPVVTSFAAVAISNAELYATARDQAQELQQIVSIAAELGSISDLEQFMRRFIQRAAEFLRFQRAFVGLLDGSGLQVRWTFQNGEHRPPGYLIPEGPLTRAVLKKEVYCFEDATLVPGANVEVLKQFNVRQLLAVPLLGANGQPLGVFGVLDQAAQLPISREDIRRAQALAAHMTAALEVSRNLLLSERHRQRSESLTSLALEIGSLVRGPDFAHKFLERAANIMGMPDAALVTQSGPNPSISVLHSLGVDHSSAHIRFARAVMAAVSGSKGDAFTRTAQELIGDSVPDATQWKEVVIAGLTGASGELLGALCLASGGNPFTSEDQQLLKAIAGEAAVALENVRFFTRMEQANRHWVEIFDAIADFIVAHDESGNVLRVNRALADFIGVQPQQLIGLNMATLLATTAPGPLPLACPFCRPTGEWSDEYVHPALERTFLVSTSQVHAASSEGLQTVHVLKDITDRREAERRYRELFDNIQEGLFFCSPDGRFIEVNDALVRILGRDSREELLHCDLRQEVFTTPEQHDSLFAEMQRQGALHNRSAALKRKDGNSVHVLINAFAVLGPQGQVSQYRGLILDVTGLKAYQLELQRERDFSGKILNNTQSLILVADTAGLVSYANRRWQVMGYEQEGIIGQPLEAVVGPASREAFRDAYASTLSGNQVDNLDLQILRTDRRIGQFSVNLSPMRDENGQVSSIVVVMSDVTDAASLQSKLMHTEKMAAVGQLVSGVAHEVNNPLTAILGFADLLMDNREIPDSARKDLRVILQEAQRTKQIVQNLLSFARQMPPQRKPMQLNPILKRTLQLRAYDLHSRGVSVKENFVEHLPFIVGDAHQLQQVFLNILNNAYDAVRDNPTSPQIEVSTLLKDGAIEVAFRDNGSGISHPDRIFDPFFTTKGVGQGTGLGLSICYGIVKEHGGEILCQNNSDGPGATFVVRLPAVRERASGMGAGGQEL